MALLFKSEIDRADLWAEALGKCDPELEVRVWPESGDPAEIEYALVWKPPQGLLKGFPNLKLIFSLGAGIDHLTSDTELPDGVPVLRMVEPGLTAGMTEYVVMSVLMHHRRMVDYAGMQREKIWAILPTPLAADRKVGVMGLGVLGADAAEALAGLGFDVAGWSRSPKSIPGVTGFHGADQLEAFLARSEILVCLLPLTKETFGILNARTLAMLPRGAALIDPRCLRIRAADAGTSLLDPSPGHHDPALRLAHRARQRRPGGGREHPPAQGRRAAAGRGERG
jgi:glyoxylate/hydroxypyruvate reductase A